MAEPEWGDFKTMLALGRGGSVAGAARLLDVDSSTVSRRLSAIEEALGAILVIRGGREFCLTAEGREAVAAAQTIEAAIARATTAIRAANTAIEGVVRISCVSTITNLLLPFRELVESQHPGLSVQFIPTNRAVDLAKGEADIAIRNIRPTEVDVIARRGFELGVAVYAAKAYLAQHGTPCSPEDLRAHQLILYSDALQHLPWFSWIEKYADPNKPAIRVESTESANGLVIAGGGIGVLTCAYGDTMPDAVRVFPEPIAYIQTWFVYHESLRNSARVKTTVDLLAEFIAARKDQLRGYPSA